ncbi:MAG: hypothetical protein LBC53_08680 [Spirochaetaceae bacterium]|nr:hypothetical protein [Spirochaetaceae bacterium]
MTKDLLGKHLAVSKHTPPPPPPQEFNFSFYKSVLQKTNGSAPFPVYLTAAAS